MKVGDPRRRSVVLLVVVVVAALALGTRLADLQVIRPERYVEWGQSQRVHIVPLPGSRGDVLDRNGEELAVSIPQPTVWADPRLVTDPEGEAAALAPVLDVDASELAARLGSDKHFVYLARAVDRSVAGTVDDLELDGVFSDLEEPRRFNPSGNDLATAVIGQVGIDNEGLSGIEYQYDEVLAGTPGELIIEQDPNGRTIPSGARELLPPQRGADLVLSIDRSLQYEAEARLVEHVELMGAKGGVVVISRPATGEVLAMANASRSDDDGVVRTTSENKAVTSTYEPGSVMKAITFAGVLDQGLGTPESTRTVNHWLNLHDATFVDHWDYGSQTFTMVDILTHSSNTGTITWAMELGEERLEEYLRRFGFGSPTGLEFKGETPGLLPPVEEWSGTTIGTVAIGNGVAVTPLQLLAAYNVIANDGVYVPPTLVLEAVDAGGERIAIDRESSRRVISAEAADDLGAMMANVVAEGTGQAAAVDGYSIAGKTGTARKPQPGGGYLDEAGNFHYVSTFAGFFPAEDPELSMVVMVDEPTTSIYASEAAAPLFADLARFSLRRLRVPPGADAVEIAGAPVVPPAPASAAPDGAE